MARWFDRRRPWRHGDLALEIHGFGGVANQELKTPGCGGCVRDKTKPTRAPKRAESHDIALANGTERGGTGCRMIPVTGSVSSSAGQTILTSSL